MMQYAVTKEEKKNLHNANAYLYMLFDRVQGVVHPDVEAELRRIKDMLEKGLKGIWQQEEEQWEKERNIQGQLAEKHDLRTSWSVSGVTDFDERPDYLNDDVERTLVYSIHWGDNPVRIELPANPTWLNLWEAADQAIRLSGDEHHIFIEAFELQEDGTVELATGS